MGWCSGTEIFDKVVKAILEPKKIDKKEVIKEIITAFEDRDWDCQADSEYINHPLVKEAFIELDPDWRKWYDD